MQKLNLDGLKVDSFATTSEAAGIRGTVAARENTNPPTCPDSWGGTCWLTCWDTCPCTDFVDCSEVEAP
ncbi:MAG TPA: hypothetical protein VF092_15065 [Longimicrobium sp.]